jgi:ADP-heptose:LPS heptosyltransferase
MGGLGSILRTTVVTKAYKEMFPDSHVTFLTHEEGTGVLSLSPSVDRVLSLNFESALVLQAEVFDDIYNFEVEPVATALTKLLKAKNKSGFSVNDLGLPAIANPEAEELFRLQVEDGFREKNTKSIQQLLVESVEMKWSEQLYDVSYQQADRQAVSEFVHSTCLSGKQIIGLNIGSRKSHALKRWQINNFIELAKMLRNQTDAVPLILAGPHEKELFEYTLRQLKEHGVVGAGPDNSFPKYVAFLDACDVVVSATTFGLLAAIGIGKKVVVVCSPKPANEICTYGKGIKLAYSPEYLPKYSTKISLQTPDEEIATGITNIPPQAVFEAVKDAMNNDFTNSLRYLKTA